MRCPLPAALLALALGLGLPLIPRVAIAQHGVMPRGNEGVVVGRLHQRTEAGIQLVARFGVVTSAKGGGTTTVEVPADLAEELGAYRVTVAARERSSGAEVTFALEPAGGGLARSARVEQRVDAGAKAVRVAVLVAGEAEVFAIVEAGRASALPFESLARAFGALPSGTEAAAAMSSGQPAPRAMASEASGAGPAVPRDSGAVLSLELRIEADGEVLFAPKVIVRSGEPFTVRGGGRVDPAGDGPYDGLEVSGTAHLAGNTCLVDLSVQSGRRLGGGAVHVVDRYRRDVRLEAGRDTVLPLFEDVSGSGAGALRLLGRCRPE